MPHILVIAIYKHRKIYLFSLYILLPQVTKWMVCIPFCCEIEAYILRFFFLIHSTVLERKTCFFPSFLLKHSKGARLKDGAFNRFNVLQWLQRATMPVCIISYLKFLFNDDTLDTQVYRSLVKRHKNKPTKRKWKHVTFASF